MALTLGSTTATAGTDFSTTVSGFTATSRFRSRSLVNSARGEFQLADRDDTTMTLLARGSDLFVGTQRIVIEEAGTQTGFDIVVSPAGYVAPPTLTGQTVTTVTAGGAVNVPAPTLSNLSGTPVFAVVDAIGGQRVALPAGLTLNADGSITGTASVSVYGLTLRATVGGQRVMSQPFSIIVTPPVGSAGSVPANALFNTQGGRVLNASGGYVLKDAA